MINTPLMSPLLSALMHGGIVGLVTWGVAGTHLDTHSDPLSYEVIFQSAPARQVVKPEVSSKVPTPRPKVTSPVIPQKAPTKEPTQYGPADEERAPAGSCSTSGMTRDPIYQGGALRNPLPTYPLIARKKGHEGRVEVQVHVSAEGKVMAVNLNTSSDHWELDEVAMTAVKSWAFLPALQNDQPIDSQQVISFDFKLAGVSVS